MRAELNDVYETFSRLDNPPLAPAELRAPGGVYLVGYDGDDAVAGGGLRRLDDGVAEIKRMYVRPAARSVACRGSSCARARGRSATAPLDTGPSRCTRCARRYGRHADNDNPFACFWGRRLS